MGNFSTDEKNSGYDLTLPGPTIRQSNNFASTRRIGLSITDTCWVTVYQNLLHLVPLTVSLILLRLNIFGYLIEPYAPSIPAIQIAAKIEVSSRL